MAVGVNIVSTFDSKGIQRAIKDFQKLDTVGQKTAYSLRTFDKALTNGAVKLAKFGAGAAIAGAIIGKTLISAASNLEESISKINAVFGDGAKSIIAWSETTAKSLGISQRTALEAAGTYGNLFQAFGLGAPQAQEMSIRLVELAADMASFNNVPIDDSLLALRAGLSGETEPLKRFGVAINDAALRTKALEMGLISTTKGTLPQAIKTQAAYALILEQTALQQGDVARTSDGVAFKMKSFGAQVEDVKSQIGTALIPIFSALMSFMNDKVLPVFVEFAAILGEDGLGEAFKYLGGEILNAIGGMGTFGNTVLILAGIFVTLKAAVVAYNVTIAVLNVLNALAKAGFLGTTVGVWALNAAMLANPIGLVIAGIVALIAVIAIIIIKFKAVRDAIANAFGWLGKLFTGFKQVEAGADDAAGGINRVNAAFEGLTKKQLKTYDTNRKFFRDSETGASALRLEIARGTKELNSFSSATGGSAKTTETAKEKLEKYIDALKGMSKAQRSARDADKSLLKSRTTLADATLKLTEAQAYFNQVVAGYGANSKQAKDRQVALRKAQGAVEKAGYDVESSVFAVTKAEQDLAAVRLDPESSAQAIREAEISLAEAKLGVKDATEAQTDATNALAEAETLLDQAINGAKEGTDAYAEALEKLNDAKKATVDANEAVTESLERQKDAVDALREAEEKAQASRVGVKPADATAAETEVGVAPKPSASYGSFLDAVKALHPNSKTLKSSTPVADSKQKFPKLFADYKAGNLVALAQGGIVTKPTAALIGEAGAEAVIPLDKLQSGMTVNVTINAGMGTDPAKLGDEIVDVLTRYNRRNGALPLKVA